MWEKLLLFSHSIHPIEPTMGTRNEEIFDSAVKVATSWCILIITLNERLLPIILGVSVQLLELHSDCRGCGLGDFEDVLLLA